MPKIMIVISGLLATLTFIAPAAALPANGYKRYYFSGPDFKKEVGERISTCDGKAREAGKETQWFYEFIYSCNAAGLPDAAQCIACEPKIRGQFRNCAVTTCPPDINIDQKL